jgi:hypothetical protein
MLEMTTTTKKWRMPTKTTTKMMSLTMSEWAWFTVGIIFDIIAQIF